MTTKFEEQIGMSLEEGNFLISEFIGGEIKTTSNGYKCFIPTGRTTNRVESLHLFPDWNYLHEIIDRIESLDFSFNIGSSTLTAYANHPFNKKGFLLQYLPWVGSVTDKYLQGGIFQDVVKKDDFNKKERVYKAIITFIKWYNKNERD